MAKTLTAGMTSHLNTGNGTTLATLVSIIRQDLTAFYFTDHDVDITFEGIVYEAAIGYDMSNITNKVGLAVDELEVSGFLESSALTDSDLRAGLFDFADVNMFLVDWTDLANGVIQTRRGKLGEVVFSDNGIFQAELRGLTQAYSQNIVQLIQSECRADLGDSKCRIELFPNVLARSTDYEVDDIVRVTSDFDGITVPTILAPFDTDGDDISPNAFTGTLTACSISSAQSQFGGASLNFTGAAGGRCSFADDAAFTIAANEFTIDAWVRMDSISATFYGIASHYNNTGGQRAWWFGLNNANMNFFASDDGSSTAPAVASTPAFAFVVDTWYHVAATRDANNILRLYVDGVQINGTRGTIDVGSANTFTRASGSFIDDGIAANQNITVAGFVVNANNNGVFTVASVAATTITITTSPLTVESGDGDESIEAMLDFDIFNSNQPITVGYVNSTADLLFDGYIDDFRFVNGSAVWTGTSFTVPASAHTPGITQALIDALVTSDFDDRVYRCVTAGTTGPTQPSFDITPPGQTTDGTAVFEAEQAYTRAIVVATVTNDRIFTVTFPEGADPREVDDWFKFGAVKWETGNNTGISMEVKGMVATTDEVTLFLTMPFEVQVGDTGFIYAGCDKSLAVCASKFSNVVNYRGEPYVPGQDELMSTPKARR